MGRQRRSLHQHGYFHVLNRGVARQLTFFDDADRADFGSVLAQSATDHGIEVHAYCLMPNHYHLVVNSPDGSLSAFMQRMVAVHTRHTNDRWGRSGPLYGGRFKSLVIDDDNYLRSAVRYVHRNPVPLTGDRGVESYRWSSHRVYLGHRRRPPWLRTDAVLGLFDNDVARYRSFMDRGDEGGLGLAAALALAIDEHLDQLDRSPNGLRKTIALHLAAEGQLPIERLCVAGATFADEHARTRAMKRAANLVSSDPVLRSISARVVELSRPTRFRV